ncbi:MAG TPA: hypothetical protein VFB22_12865 [Candidatus Baltobacteraceae bacterium]|nr:hypothetical protein [Candidatus Baltobacteraceae bacterium]
MRSCFFARTLPVAVLAAASLLGGCGGGGGGGGGSVAPPPVQPTATPTVTPTPFPGATATLYDIAASQTLAAYEGNSGTIALAPSGGNASLAIAETTSLIPPVPVPTFPPDPTTGGAPTALLYITLVPSAAVTFVEQPTLSLTLATAPPASDILVAAYYNASLSAEGWVYSTVPRESPGSPTVTLFGNDVTVNVPANEPYVAAVLEVPSGGTTAHLRR